MKRDSRQDDHVQLWTALKEISAHVSPERRRQFYLLLGLMLLGALADLATIGAVLPFLSLLAGGDLVADLPALQAYFGAAGAEMPRERLLAATALFAIVVVTAALIRLQLARSTRNFVFALGPDIAVEIQRRILLQPYSFHVNQNTSRLIASLDKVQTLVFDVLLQIIQAGIALFISAFIIAALIQVDLFAALAAAVVFPLIYSLVSTVTWRRLANNSAAVGSAYDERVKIVQESLGGIRDVIIDSSQQVYLKAFRRVEERFGSARADIAFVATAPRFIIEPTGMIVIAATALLIWEREGGVAGALPILGALAIGAQRLLPLIQQVYQAWSSLAGHHSVLTDVVELLRLPVPEEEEKADVEPLPLRSRILLEEVSFSYPSRRGRAVDKVSLEIPRGSSVALIGRTGSGKSTLVDLIMGLLEPTEGRISVDGVPLTNENRRQWRRSIAHVPQSIFLADSSIARNIALSVPSEALDQEQVIEAATRAQLHEFVESLPDGYETQVGERGVRLSGGQRQRLGIARSIYKQAPVLVLDEATSALDETTESAVMDALQLLGEEGRTIIVIAHRLSTIARSDIVVRLDKGRAQSIGRYDDVVGEPGRSNQI